jgi:hypothetical protein
VFRRFEELGSARQVLLSVREDGLLLPRRRNGSKRITWLTATYPAVHDFLTNPAYAGAFVFGRTRTEKRVDTAGRVIVRVRQLPRDEWAVLIPDHHPGFITWSQYEANTARLRANWRAPRGHGGGAPREGRALLQGLLQCGKCGRTMQTGYSGPAGNSPRYVCARAQQLYGTGPGCQSIGGGRLEKTVLQQLFAILEPASLQATATALAEADAHYRQRLSAFELAVQRARYETERAHRQYDAVEPENRLVARTLERALEDKLAALRRTENDLATGAGPPAGHPHRGRGRLDQPGRRRCRQGLPRHNHHDPRAQTADPGGHRPHRAHHQRRRPRRRPAHHLAGRGQHRAVDGDDQTRRPYPHQQ